MQRRQFLCSNHQQWLSQNPQTAKAMWEEFYSRGVDLIEERDYRNACLHAGAAVEIADILLAFDTSEAAITKLSDSTKSLARALYLDKDATAARDVVANTVSCLKRLTPYDFRRQQILAACQDLNQLSGEELSVSYTFLNSSFTGTSAGYV